MGRVVGFKHTGNFQKTDRLLHGIIESYYTRKLKKYALRGVEALKEATPKDSGKTADSWAYEIVEEPGSTATRWPMKHGRRLSDERRDRETHRRDVFR